MIQFLFGASLVAQMGATLSAGEKASTEARYNAKIKDQQAKMIDRQITLSNTQWDRSIEKTSGTLVSRVASSGITMSGSPTVALLDMTIQMETDKAIEEYNLKVQKFGVESEAAAFRRESKAVKQASYANAFSSALMGGFNYYTGFRK